MQTPRVVIEEIVIPRVERAPAIPSLMSLQIPRPRHIIRRPEPFSYYPAYPLYGFPFVPHEDDSYPVEGVMFDGLTPIPWDYAVDPRDNECYNCRRRGHIRIECHFPHPPWKVCFNCGRKGSTLETCHRCKKAHAEWLYGKYLEKAGDHPEPIWVKYPTLFASPPYGKQWQNDPREEDPVESELEVGPWDEPDNVSEILEWMFDLSVLPATVIAIAKELRTVKALDYVQSWVDYLFPPKNRVKGYRIPGLPY